MKEGHTTDFIKEIIQNRHEVMVSKRRIQKFIKKYNKSGLYVNEKRSGRPPKLSKSSQRIIHRLCVKNRAICVRNITSSFNIQGSVQNFNKIRLAKSSGPSEVSYNFQAMEK